MRRRIVYSILVTGLLLSPALGWASLQGSGGHVCTIQGSRLDIHGKRALVLPLLEEITRKTGLQVYVFDAILGDRITIELRNATLETALRTLLRGHNYAVIYTQGTRPPSGSQRKGEVAGGRDGKAVMRPLHSSGSNTPGTSEIIANASRVPSDKSGHVFVWGEPARPTAAQGFHRGASSNQTASTAAAGLGETVTPGTSSLEAAASARSASGYGEGSTTTASLSESTGIETPVAGYGSGAGDPAASVSSATAGAQANAREIQPEDAFEEAQGGDPGPDQTSTALSQVEHLENLIEEIEGRLASGQSDAAYDRWMSIYGDERYVMHDSVLLEITRKRLARAQGKS